MIKELHLGDILSITGNKLLSPRLIEGVYDILNFMTGDSLFKHQLLRAQEVCKPILLKQYPELAKVDDSEVNGENWGEWLDKQINQYGEYLAVISLNEWEHRDPLEELIDMVGEEKVIVVNHEAQP